MLGFWFRSNRRHSSWFRPLARTYQAISSASVDELWQKVINLADVSWHPLLASTDVPRGIIAKPGLIYKAVTRLIPITIHIFVEKVCPQELLSVRIMALPGLEERVTYRVESTVCGTRISYTVCLKGWLSPLLWSLLRPYAARVAAELVLAVERENQQAASSEPKFFKSSFQDLLSIPIVIFGVAPLVNRFTGG